MDVQFPPMVKETSTDTGTNAFDLDGAVSGFRTFLAALPSSGNVPYIITADSGDYEFGVGYYSHTANTLARSFSIVSSNSNAKVNFSAGDKTVAVGVSPYMNQHCGYRVEIDETAQIANSNELQYDNIIYDNGPDTIMVVGSSSTNLLVPGWANFMKISGNVGFFTGVAGDCTAFIKPLTLATYTDQLEGFGFDVLNSGTWGELSICTGWVEPSYYGGNYGLQIEMNHAGPTTQTFSGVISVEYKI